MEEFDSSDLLAKVRHIHIRTRRLVSDLMAGEYLSAFKGQGMEFDEVREYQPGDDVRAIDWNVTARTGVPHIKRFVEERELTILILVDTSASVQFGTTAQHKKEAIAQLASVFAFTAMVNNDKVGLMLFDDHIQKFIPPVKGKSQVLRVIQEVLTAPIGKKKTDIASALDILNQIQKKRAVVFLISDFYSSDFSQSLRRTSRRHDVICVNLNDRQELDLLPLGLFEVEDAETGELLVVDFSNSQTKKEFKAQVARHQEELKKNCQLARAELIHLTASEDWSVPLMKFFKQRERRLSHYA